MAKQRVLIMDDDTSFRAGIREVLERSGYAVAEAADGPEGLAKVETFRPDVILLDVLMPNLDGCEVCQRLKANPPTAHIAVLFVTAVKDEAVRHLAMEAGAVAYITKPFESQTLVAGIDSALAKTQRQPEDT
jgi:CheY-like chemotaxis protein